MKLGIVNTKGGVGKTTTTVYLAAAGVGEGLRVQVQDLDKQASATDWLAPLPAVENFSVGPGNAYTVKRPNNADLVLIDTGPGDPRDVELASQECDFVIVPSAPGEINDERTQKTVAYLEANGVRHAVVLVQTDERTRATKDSRAAMIKRTAVFDTEIPHRESIRKSYGQWPGELYGYDDLLAEIRREAGADK